MRKKQLGHLTDLGRKAARWTTDHDDQLRDADPDLPEIPGDDRVHDNWRPLIAIADLISKEWGAKVRVSAIKLETDNAVDDSSAAVMVLEDVAAILEEKGLVNQKGIKSLPSVMIVEELIKMADRPWGEWKRGQPMTQNSLASLLGSVQYSPEEYATRPKRIPRQGIPICSDRGGAKALRHRPTNEDETATEKGDETKKENSP